MLRFIIKGLYSRSQFKYEDNFEDIGQNCQRARIKERNILKRKDSSFVDEVDHKILNLLQKNGRISLEELSVVLGMPKSTIFYRIKQLEEEKFIEGYHAKINHEKLGEDFLTITFVRAKYGPSYDENIGRKMSEINGVYGVYFILGDNDFVVLTRSSGRKDFQEKLEKLMVLEGVERTNTYVITKIIKEDLSRLV
jgi:DNA-binding Lrp family transcriptional regulator